jgi:hypothetical protein
MEWDYMGCVGRYCFDKRLRANGLAKTRAVERRARYGRLPRRGCDCLSCDRRNSRRGVWNKPWRSAGGTLGLSFTISDFRTFAIPVAHRQCVTRPDADSKGFTIITTCVGRFPSPKARTLADSETTTGQKHLRRAGKPLGLQLLRRQLHHESCIGLLQLLQVHCQLLEKHPWVC